MIRMMDTVVSTAELNIRPPCTWERSREGGSKKETERGSEEEEREGMRKRRKRERGREGEKERWRVET